MLRPPTRRRALGLAAVSACAASAGTPTSLPTCWA
ncbi:twin-arginine translocation signal domain-containing protein [Dehalogenimonas sp. 4OHTPN]|uniref:Twin-arginine translocation signal domain-containing protein n=1 Tax=Dehalogenimonas sp. 4OHTPN TaxID=3166643 RepID=A0AAU8G826_9CHLR